MDFVSEYVSYIVDECGDIVCRANDKNAEEVLESHPEYSIKCLPITT